MTAQEITDTIDDLKNHKGDSRHIGAAINALLRLRSDIWREDKEIKTKTVRNKAATGKSLFLMAVAQTGVDMKTIQSLIPNLEPTP